MKFQYVVLVSVVSFIAGIALTSMNNNVSIDNSSDVASDIADLIAVDSSSVDSSTGSQAKRTPNNNMNATLWVQTAAEYKANSMQAFNAALNRIDSAIEDASWVSMLEQQVGSEALPPAIVLDVDETVLDNTQYGAQNILIGAEFVMPTWDQWVALKSAPEVPGAVEFINNVKAKGVEVIYITNRECQPRPDSKAPCPQKEDTADNLRSIGIKGVNSETLLLKSEHAEWTSEKKSRRAEIAKKYRVVMLFGDDLGDFLPNVKKNITPQQRDELVAQYKTNWGNKWFVFSNPTYGSWQRVLSEPNADYLQGY